VNRYHADWSAWKPAVGANTVEIGVHDAAPREQAVITNGYFLHATEAGVSNHDTIANDDARFRRVRPRCRAAEDDDVSAEYDLSRTADVKTAEDAKVSASSKPLAQQPVPDLVIPTTQERESDTKRLPRLPDRAEILNGAQSSVIMLIVNYLKEACTGGSCTSNATYRREK
jgi:hypothetical protein